MNIYMSKKISILVWRRRRYIYIDIYIYDRVSYHRRENKKREKRKREKKKKKKKKKCHQSYIILGGKHNDRRMTATPVVAATRTVTRRNEVTDQYSPSSPGRNNNNNSNYTGDNNILEVLGFGIHLKSRSKRLRDSPPSSLNTSKDGSDGDVLDTGSTDLRSRQALSFIDVPNERYDYIGELCGRSVEEECTVMDGTHVVIHPPPPSTSGGIVNLRHPYFLRLNQRCRREIFCFRKRE